MKKLIFTTVLLFLCSNSSFSMPVYTDEIPQEHLNKVDKLNKIINTDKPSFQQDFDEELPIENKVPVYTDKKIAVKWVKNPNATRNDKLLNLYNQEPIGQVKYPAVGSKLEFIVAEDIFKDGKIYIKKDTKAEGYVSLSQAANAFDATIAPELQIQSFTTKDVTGKTVHLQGKIHNKSRMNYLTWYIAGYALNPAKVKKDKIYTLYYK